MSITRLLIIDDNQVNEGLFTSSSDCNNKIQFLKEIDPPPKKKKEYCVIQTNDQNMLSTPHTFVDNY